MRHKYKYGVFSRHDCERQMRNADRLLSTHHTLSAAQRAADREHTRLDGCPG